MTEWITQRMADATAGTWAVVGALVTAVICAVLTRPAAVTCEAPDSVAGRWSCRSLGCCWGGTGLLHGRISVSAYARSDPQPDVAGSREIVYHAICLGLLLVITATDHGFAVHSEFRGELGTGHRHHRCSCIR